MNKDRKLPKTFGLNKFERDVEALANRILRKSMPKYKTQRAQDSVAKLYDCLGLVIRDVYDEREEAIPYEKRWWQHPRPAKTPEEQAKFDRYVARLRARWAKEAQAESEGGASDRAA